MQPSDKPAVNPVVVLREEFDDWAVLFNPDTAAAIGINPMGVNIWKRLDGQRSLADVVEVIKKDYRDVPDGVAEDVTSFVSQLTEQGFIGQTLEQGAS